MKGNYKLQNTNKKTNEKLLQMFHGSRGACFTFSRKEPPWPAEIKKEVNDENESF